MDNFEKIKEYEAHKAQVPSYKEYQQLLSDELAKNECVEINAELEAKNAQLKFENDWYSELLSDAAKDVGQLKALLKERRELLSDRKMYGINTSKTWNILVLINQVLGEE